MNERELAQEDYIRHKLYSGQKSAVRRYSELVIGGGSIGTLIRYELITMLLGSFPGALGLALRRIFYPMLFQRVGRGVVFGRNLVIRNPHQIVLGDRVLIDDNCLIDARGAGADGIVIGAETVIHRGCSIQAKIGPIRIGASADIGAGSVVISQGGTELGDMVTLAGGCKIGGGSIRVGARAAESVSGVESRNDFSARGHARVSRGPIRIGDRCIFATGASVLDGVDVGEGTLVGAGAVIRESVAADSVVIPHQKLVVLPREHFAAGSTAENREVDSASPPRAAASPFVERQESRESVEEPSRGRVAEILFAVIEEINEQLPEAQRIRRELDAPLIEPLGPLDSLGLINLVVGLEEAIARDLGVSVEIASAAAGADARPFATPGTLTRHVEDLLQQRPGR